MTNAFVPTCNFTSPAGRGEGMHYLKMFTFFGEVNVISSNGHSLQLSSALSSCIHAPHSELQPSPAGALRPLHPSHKQVLPPVPCCPPCCAAQAGSMAMPFTWTGDDAAKIVSLPLLNDMISLLSFIVGKTKTRKGGSLSSQPWH